MTNEAASALARLGHQRRRERDPKAYKEAQAAAQRARWAKLTPKRRSAQARLREARKRGRAQR